jgi:hypothetical protein
MCQHCAASRGVACARRRAFESADGRADAGRAGGVVVCGKGEDWPTGPMVAVALANEAEDRCLATEQKTRETRGSEGDLMGV